MHDPPIRQVPPGSSPLRELAHAIEQALVVPRRAAARDELTYLRITRDRARLVSRAMRRMLDDRDDSDEGVMTAVTILRSETGQLADDEPGYEPEPEL